MKKLLVILGPTSTGKTDLAIFLAKKFNGELISADSRQIYKGLDIGTGKLPDEKFHKGDGFWEVNGIKIWMYDVVSPTGQYNVAKFVDDTKKIIDRTNKLLIIVGGTGLYIKALVDGLPNLSIPFDKKQRKELEKLDLLALQEKIKESSFKRWEEMNNSDRQNPRRLIRAIELAGVKPAVKHNKNYNLLKIGLTAPRVVLYQRADKRVISRINIGMIEEAENLHKNGLSLKRMKQLGLEYAVLADFIEGKIKNEKELIKILQGKIHGFIKRQITWFKKEKNVHWFDISKQDYYIEVEKLVWGWYDSSKYA